MLIQPISSEMNAFSIQLLFFLSHFMFVFPLNKLLNDFVVVIVVQLTIHFIFPTVVAFMHFMQKFKWIKTEWFKILL